MAVARERWGAVWPRGGWSRELCGMTVPEEERLAGCHSGGVKRTSQR